jgi:hypothetical protein
MDAIEDNLFELIGQLDPTRNEPPPAPGSVRRRSILEVAMSSTVTAPSAVDPEAGPVASARRQPRPWRRLAGFAAAVVAATGAVVFWPSGEERTAEAAVRSAAEALGDVTSFEGERTHVEPGVSNETMTLRVNGDDFEFVAETRFADGRVERFTAAIVDRVQYIGENRRTVRAPAPPGEGLDTPYGPASTALVAAVTDSDVTEGGNEPIAGVLTTRYDVALTARSIASLSSLPPEDLNWFDLEDPGEVDQFTVWIAGGHIRRVEIAHGDRATTVTTFFNHNGDITISPPPGPYEEAVDG